MASERARAEAQRAQKGAKPKPGALVDEGDDLDPDLKGAAKAARQLLQDAMPWTEPQEGGTNGRGPMWPHLMAWGAVGCTPGLQVSNMRRARQVRQARRSGQATRTSFATRSSASEKCWNTR